MALYASETDSLTSGELVPLTGTSDDYDLLLDLVAGRRFVLLGEPFHGSHEFYEERARITRRLIEEKGFTAVAIEADWPDAYRLNRFVLGDSDDPGVIAALADFKRFPGWMWRNVDIVQFIAWLRSYNDAHPDLASKVRFYGLDLYSRRASMEAVVAYLDSVDPEAAAQARARYGCLDHVQSEGPAYGQAVSLDLMVPCENEVVAELMDLRREQPPSWRVMVGWQKTSCSLQSRTLASSTTPSGTTGPCTKAGPRRGTSGTDTWSGRCQPCPDTSIVSGTGQRWSCGSTTRTWVTLEQPSSEPPAS